MQYNCYIWHHKHIARVVLNTTIESARQQHVPLINNSNNNTINQYLILLPTVRQLVRLCPATYPAMNSHTKKRYTRSKKEYSPNCYVIAA